MPENEPKINEGSKTTNSSGAELSRDIVTLSNKLLDQSKIVTSVEQRLAAAEAKLAALNQAAGDVANIIAAIQNHAQRLATLSRHRHGDDGTIFVPLET